MVRSNENSLRIIGGQWRGRKLAFPKIDAIRPTPSRVRETLFNWLAPMISGANCLDCFTGSGALGFEALSRGAASVTFCDNNPKIISTLKQHAALLESSNGVFVQTDTLSFLNRTTEQFNLIFLDPPFNSDLLAQCFEFLSKSDCLASEAMIYVEAHLKEELPSIPSDWLAHRNKKAGDVAYYLFIKE